MDGNNYDRWILGLSDEPKRTVKCISIEATITTVLASYILTSLRQSFKVPLGQRLLKCAGVLERVWIYWWYKGCTSSVNKFAISTHGAISFTKYLQIIIHHMTAIIIANANFRANNYSYCMTRRYRHQNVCIVSKGGQGYCVNIL